MKETLLGLVASCLIGVAPSARAQCAGDLVPDGRVDGADLGVLLAYWGSVTGSALSQASDLNHDDFVDGNDLGSLLGKWGWCPSVLTEVVPDVGVVSGGATVRLRGQFLTGTSGVHFGAAAATSFVVLTDTEVLAVTPPGSPGSVNVSVSGPRGTATALDGFTYLNFLTPSWAVLVEPFPDPAVVTDPELRRRIAVSGWAWRVRDNQTQIEMLLVPPGTFEMGCSPSAQFACDAHESPVRTVTLTNPFYMGRFEVTQAQWTAQMGSNSSGFQNPSAEVPIELVPHRPFVGDGDALPSAFLAATGMRLPTEAEWEFACRAGCASAFNNGSGIDESVVMLGWTSGNAANQTRPVGQKAANRLGFHDMHGNAWERVSDWYSDNYYAVGPSVNPTGPSSGWARVIRGGAYDRDTNSARVSYRKPASGVLGGSTPGVGFRVVRDP